MLNRWIEESTTGPPKQRTDVRLWTVEHGGRGAGGERERESGGEREGERVGEYRTFRFSTSTAVKLLGDRRSLFRGN